MEARFFTCRNSPFLAPRNHHRRRGVKQTTYTPTLAVLTRPSDRATGVKEKTITGPEGYSGIERAVARYKDNWFDLMAINYLSEKVQRTTGILSKKSGYEGLVEAAAAAYWNFNPNYQRELVISALSRAFPKLILNLIRTLLPQSQFTREYFAAFTTLFFSWLVGECEVRESELDGRRERNVVHIKKCRFLEESNCVGMCLNLCKMPCQTFIKDSLGMPVNMVPNFDDMSCQMVFGQEPSALSDDPAFKQPCFTLCKAKRKHSTTCTS